MTAIHHPLPKLHWSVVVGTFFYAGLSPKAPGTVGSLVTLPIAYIVQQLLGSIPNLSTAIILLLVFIPPVLLFIVGYFAMRDYMRRTGRSDPPEMVIDEVAAQWLLCIAVPQTLQGYAIAFVLFRLFDIWKPWPIRWIDRRWKSAFGAMFDDTLAALMPITLFLLVMVVCFSQRFGVSGIMQFLVWLNTPYVF